MTVLTGFRFFNVFDLPDKRKWLFRANRALGKYGGICIRGKGEIIIAAIFEIGCTTLRMAPNTIFQNIVPNETASRFRKRRICAN